jgi:YesN/AraC family two-component response regulator
MSSRDRYGKFRKKDFIWWAKWTVGCLCLQFGYKKKPFLIETKLPSDLMMEFYMLQHELAQPQTKGKQRLLPLLDYIDEHITEQMTLQDLAGVLNITPQHLCRTFKEAFSMRPFEYITRRRIQISKRYLADRNMKIAAVGQMVGIPDVSYYCYNFKRLEGITPNEFRAQNF